MRKRVFFHGRFKKLFPEPIEIVASTAEEAIAGVTRQLPQLRPVPGKRRHCFKVLDFDTVESLKLPTDVEEIHLYPNFSGGKDSGGFLQIAIGAVLIAAAIFMPPSIGGLVLVEGVTLGSVVFSLGVSLALGGLLALMSPAPKRDLGDSTGGAGDPEPSKYLGAPRNTAAVGTRIPIGYGRHMIYGHYLSFDIQAKDVSL